MPNIIYLQIYKHSFYKLKSQEQLKKIIQLSAHRGAIFDRHQRPLALTTASYSVYAAPYDIEDKDALKTFNCGIGFVIIIDKENQKHFTETCKNINEEVYLIGEVLEGTDLLLEGKLLID